MLHQTTVGPHVLRNISEENLCLDKHISQQQQLPLTVCHILHWTGEMFTHQHLHMY